MDWKKKAREAKVTMENLLQTAKKENRAFTDQEKVDFDEAEKEFNNAIDMIEKEKKMQAVNGRVSDEDDDDDGGGQTPRVQITDQRTGPFKNLVDQLSAVKAAADGFIDERLKTVNAALGMNEGQAKDGGFGVQSDFAGLLIDTAVKDDPLLSLVDTYNVSAGSNSVKWVDIDEKGSVETYVFGGVRVYWKAEAGAVTATKPQLKDKELKLEMLMGMAYATYELNADSSFVDQLYSRAFQLAIRRELGGCIINGTGVGKPLGFLKSPALVEVPKETSQDADTINWKNISKMYHRALNKPNMKWVLHPDSHEQLDFLEFPVGTGGVPVYLPATQQGALDMLRGRQIIESDHCPALGDKGDINFFDPTEYVMIYKGGVQEDVSIHVQFLTAENAFRFIFRANGIPKRSTDIQIKNSSKKRSPYITLAARA